MCPTQRLTEERSCSGNCVITPNVFKNTVLGVAAVTVVFGYLSFWEHLIEFTLIAVGALVVGYVAAFAYFRHIRPAQRAQAQAISAAAAAAAAGQLRRPVAQPYQQLPQAEVHQHLHLHGADAMQQWQDRQR